MANSAIVFNGPILLFAITVIALGGCSTSSDEVPDGLMEFMFKSDPAFQECGRKNPKLRESIADEITLAPALLASQPARFLFIKAKSTSTCFCGNRTCSSWIVKTTNGEFQILGGEAGTIQSSSSNGLKDVIHEAEVSDGEDMRTLYRFDGAKYVAVDCSLRDKHEGDGNYHEVRCMGVTGK